MNLWPPGLTENIRYSHLDGASTLVGTGQVSPAGKAFVSVDDVGMSSRKQAHEKGFKLLEGGGRERRGREAGL